MMIESFPPILIGEAVSKGIPFVIQNSKVVFSKLTGWWGRYWKSSRYRPLLEKVGEKGFMITETFPNFDLYRLNQQLISPLKGKLGQKSIYIMKKGIKKYSGYYSIIFYNSDTKNYVANYSVAFGYCKTKPVINHGCNIWDGEVDGHEMSKGVTFVGKVYIRYNFEKSTVDISIYNIKYKDCFKTPYLYWKGIPVKENGYFNYPPKDSVNAKVGDDHIEGSFYGNCSTETAGIFTWGVFSGGWSAYRTDGVIDLKDISMNQTAFSNGT